jgi:hypothetical protein
MAMMLPLMSMAEPVTFEGRARSTVSVGERFQLTYSVSANVSDIRLGEVKDFELLFGPSLSRSSSTSIFNGSISTSETTTFTYVLKASKAGEFVITPATIEIDGTQYTSNIVKIRVVEGQEQESSQSQSSSSGNVTLPKGQVPDIMLVQQFSKSSVYEGEPVDLITKIYTKVGIEQITEVNSPKLVEFMAEDIERHNGNGREVVDGVIYQTAEIKRQVLFPQKSGRFTLEPIECECVVKRRVGGGGGIFDDFFGQVQLVKQRVKSKPISVTVKELPDHPSQTSGGVGTLDFKVTVTPQEVKADNTVQVKVTVSGTGNLKYLSLPKPEFNSDFDTFDPSESNHFSLTSAGYKGSKSAEYLVIPRHEGEFVIPAMKFTYFDLNKKQFVTLTQGPFTLNVLKGDGTSDAQGVVKFSGGSREEVQYIGGDLRYLRLTEEPLKLKNDFFLGSGLFYTLIIVPVLILVVFVLLYRKHLNDLNNMDKVKVRRANKQAKKRLRTAAKFIKENKREAFFDEVMRALWGYLSDKLTLPLSELTKDNAKEEMQRHSISSEAADEFMHLLDTCEFARYAPAELSESMQSVYDKAVDVIGRLNDNIK